MAVSRSFTLVTLMAVLCLGPVMTEAASLHRTESVETGSKQRSVLTRIKSKALVYQLQPEKIQQSILRVLEQEMREKVRAIHAVVIDPLDPMTIPSGDIGLRVSPKGVEEGLGRRVFRVHITKNGEPWQTIEAIADVSASIDAVVPTRVIQIDSVIEAEDVTVHRVKLMDLDHQLITNVKDVIGKSAARPLQTNNPIRLGMVKKPYAVRKGDRVSIEARHEGLLIQAVGMTKASGELGQFVTVTNIDSGKELRAKIVGPGAVRVEF